MSRVAKRRLLLVVTLVAAVMSSASVGVSLAQFRAAATAVGNLQAGYWNVFYLHNKPTPPGAATNAQADLAMDASAPAAPSYPNTPPAYSVDCATGAGRFFDSSNKPSSPACTRQNWLSPVLTDQIDLLAGTSATVDAWWSASRSAWMIALDVTLNDVDPGNVRHQLAFANIPAFASSTSFAAAPLAIPIATAHTVPAGDRLELIIAGSTRTQGNKISPFMAYDTVLYPSSLTLP